MINKFDLDEGKTLELSVVTKLNLTNLPYTDKTYIDMYLTWEPPNARLIEILLENDASEMSKIQLLGKNFGTICYPSSTKMAFVFYIDNIHNEEKKKVYEILVNLGTTLKLISDVGTLNSFIEKYLGVE